MASFVHLDYPAQHPGVVRADGLAASVQRAYARMAAAVAAWNARRVQAEEDHKLWALALTDARVMSEISRAMTTDANRSVKGYY